MRPPICEICDKEFDPDKESGLIDFKETSEGIAFPSEFLRLASWVIHLIPDGSAETILGKPGNMRI